MIVFKKKKTKQSFSKTEKRSHWNKNCDLNFASKEKIYNLKIESLKQTLIFSSIFLYNPMSYTLDISNYEFCWIKV